MNISKAKVIKGLASFALFFSLNIIYAGQAETETRAVINTFQEEIEDVLKYTPEELKKLKTEFQDYYHEEVIPRLSKIANNISSKAIHWVDLNYDGKQELIFWTEGLSPTSWGAKEFLFIAKQMKNDEYKLIKSVELDIPPTRGALKYSHSRFWERPNKGKGYNSFLGAVFSYGAFGGSGSTFVNYEISWNRYKNTISIDKFLTSFAIDIAPLHENNKEND